MSSGKHWCLTINNPTDEDVSRFDAIKDLLKYSVVGREIGESGTPHLQCYIVFHKQVRLNFVSTLFPRAHCEVKSKKSTPHQAAIYCKKDGDYSESGELPLPQTAAATQAASEKWQNARVLAEADMLDDVDPEIFIKHYATLKKIRSEQRNKEIPETLDWVDPPNEWLWGPTGSGKSRTAREENPSAYIKMNNKWWEGYQDEDVVLIEDVGKSHEWMGDHLKIWGDRYGFRAEVKHDSNVLRPKKVVVTSNYSIRSLWPDPSIYEPLERRFRVREFQMMKPVDDSSVPPKIKRKRTSQAQKYDREVQLKKTRRPPLYRQTASGELVRTNRDALDEAARDAIADSQMIRAAIQPLEDEMLGALAFNEHKARVIEARMAMEMDGPHYKGPYDEDSFTFGDDVEVVDVTRDENL